MIGLTKSEIMKVINRYIGVDGGYLGNLSYMTHSDFYPEYCDIDDIDTGNYKGTTRERFISILSNLDPQKQATVLHGVLSKFPIEEDNAPKTRTVDLKNEILQIIERLKNAPAVPLRDAIHQSKSRRYYSVRNGINKDFSGYSLDILKKLFLDLYKDFDNKGYFQEYFGYNCVDVKFVPGKLGLNIAAQIYRLLRKENIWPIYEYIEYFSEDDLFDVIEFLFDHISKPIETPNAYHSWNDCGWHYNVFNKQDGQVEFILYVNELLIEYQSGFEVSKDGIILIKDEGNLSDIYDAEVPTKRDDIKTKINLAVQKYRESRSDLEIRRMAIRELADILEILRLDAKKYLNDSDESDLFNIANNFSIRHANDKQKIKYDRNIWYSWIFYLYLSTIHALLRMKERESPNN